MSNLMALLLQSLSARLGIVRGLDLAQASQHTYPPMVNIPLYILAEIAIAACDLAEVIGMAIGLHLLFGLPLTARRAHHRRWTRCWCCSSCNKGMRQLEVFILSMVAIIGLSFLAEMFIVQPELAQRDRGTGAIRPVRQGAVHRHRHHRRHGDAAQPVPALGAGADPRRIRTRCRGNKGGASASTSSTL